MLFGTCQEQELHIVGEGQTWRINGLLEDSPAAGKSKKVAEPAIQGLWLQVEDRGSGRQVVGI